MYDIIHFRSVLENRKRELTQKIAQVEDFLDDPKSASFSEQAVESEFDEVYEAQGRASVEELHAIDAALDRIKNNKFGICTNCGESISRERLEAVPHAARCRNCFSKN